MITGTVNADLEARVSIDVIGRGNLSQSIDAVVDTGFNGFLTLPPATIAALGLTWLARAQGTLADGSVELFDVYRAAVTWDSRRRPIEVEAAESESLLGMALLQRHVLNVEVIVGGEVRITAIP